MNMQVIHEESKDDSHDVIHQIDEEITRLKEREQKVTSKEVRSDRTDPGEIDNRDDLGIDEEQEFFLVKDAKILKMIEIPNIHLEYSCIRKGITHFDIAQRLFTLDVIEGDP